MSNTPMTHSVEPNFSNGWWFFFEYKGHQITHHSSALNGRERIWIDDELVVNKIGWGFFNTHKLVIEGDELTLKTGFIRPLHAFTSRVDAQLYLGNNLLEHSHRQFLAGRKLAWQFMMGACAGVAIGFFLRSILGG